MLLVIFGAGASYDSVPHFPPPPPPTASQSNWALVPPSQMEVRELYRPPLANQLFDDRPIFVGALDRFGDCKALVPLLRRSGVVVEQELGRIQDQAAKFPQRLRQLAAIRYYLHFALWECQRQWNEAHRGVNNYVTLLDELERWRCEFSEAICFVTFNYDTMLEQAMQQYLRVPMNELKNYISMGGYLVIKPHGSVNWGREVDGIEPSNALNHQDVIDMAANLRISNRYRLVTSHPMLSEEHTILFPAISIPLQNKDEFSCPNEHIDVMRQTLPMVTKVITVGWRATEATFLHELASALAEKKPDLMIVSGGREGAAETYSNLVRSGVVFSTHTPIEDGFTGMTNALDKVGAFLHEWPRSEAVRQSGI